MDSQRETRFAEVLQLVVQHCPDANIPATLCALLGVNSKVNAALKQCRGQCDIRAHLGPFSRYYSFLDNYILHLGAFAGFTRWLPKHAGLVSCISAYGGSQGDYETQNPLRLQEMDATTAGAQLLSAALQLATTAASPAPAQRPPLRLEFFKSSFAVDTELLAALKASEVKVANVFLERRTTGPSICRAFGQLTSLQELTINTVAGDGLPAHLVRALQKLPTLKVLNSDSLWPGYSDWLPQSLTGLCVRWNRCSDGKRVELSHLTALEWLDWRTEQPFRSMRAVLPSQLTSLDVYSPLSVASMPKLQAAMLEAVCHDTLQLLEGLRSLDDLEVLTVIVPWTAEHLPQDALTAAVAAVGQLTSLTSLVFSTADPSKDHDNIVSLVDIPLGSALRRLKKLEYLQLQVGPIDRDDLLSLTELTALTALDLFAPCLDDFLAVAVLSHLTQLQELTLESEGLRTGVLMAPLSKLTDLRHLTLRLFNHAVHLGRVEVMQLWALKQLSSLWIRPRIRASLVDELFAQLPELDPEQFSGVQRVQAEAHSEEADVSEVADVNDD